GPGPAVGDVRLRRRSAVEDPGPRVLLDGVRLLRGGAAERGEGDHREGERRVTERSEGMSRKPTVQYCGERRVTERSEGMSRKPPIDPAAKGECFRSRERPPRGAPTEGRGGEPPPPASGPGNLPGPDPSTRLDDLTGVRFAWRKTSPE